MVNPRVSVIIPNYNYGKFLHETITSVLNQTYEKIEIIVVNNGSTDNSMEVLKTFGDSITLIDQKNLGQAVARNVGIRHASGELIALLDADDIWLPNKIESQMALISESVQLVYCGIHFVNSKADVITKTVHPKFRNSCLKQFEIMPWSAIVVGGESTAMFSRKIYEEVGGFSNKLSTSSGWDFFRKCSLQTNFDFTDQVYVLYRQHDENISRDRKLIYSNMVKSGYICIVELFRAGKIRAACQFFCRSTWVLCKSICRDLYTDKLERFFGVK